MKDFGKDFFRVLSLLSHAISLIYRRRRKLQANDKETSCFSSLFIKGRVLGHLTEKRGFFFGGGGRRAVMF